MNPAIQDALGNLLVVVIGIASTILGVLGGQLIQFLQGKKKELKKSLGESNYWLLEQAAETVVNGVEQLAKSAPGQEKIQMALEGLAEIARMNKIDVSADLLRTFAEAAVKEMNEEKAKTKVIASAEPLKWAMSLPVTSIATPPTE